MAEQMQYTPRSWRVVEKGRGWRDARRIAACVHACEGIPTEALEIGVIRDLINAATRYLQITTRDTDDDPNCWFEEEFTRVWLHEVLAKVRGEA